jgi:hypothetical protein
MRWQHTRACHAPSIQACSVLYFSRGRATAEARSEQAL